MEEEMITHRGERETESDVKGGEMQICMFHWMVKEKKGNGRATIITVSSAIDSCTGINFRY